MGVEVDNDSVINNFSVGNITPVSIASGKTLSGAIEVTAGSIKLVNKGTLASNVEMSGGTTFDADNSLSVSGALTQSGDITIDVLDNQTLIYTGPSLSLGASTLSLSGGGTFANTMSLVLDNAASKLCLLYTSPSPRDLSTSRMPSSA